MVNLSYVINVIEEPKERVEALRQAWRLCQKLLVVAAQLDLGAPDKERQRLGDGIITSRNTFQKYYTQAELRTYLERTLATEAIPAAPGVFYLFKEESARQQFLANRFRRQITVPQRRVSEVLFEQNQDVLEPFMRTFAQLGRLPGPEEFVEYPLLVERFGSAKRALSVVNRATGVEAWTAIATRRAEDLLVYLALSHFEKRPALSALPPSTQRDAKAFFGSYQRACAEADALLFKVGAADAIDAACCRSKTGYLVDNALLIHCNALTETEPLLRIYEGCARALLGEVEEADIIKLHRHSGKVSYLGYHNFETDPRPRLRFRIKVTLPTITIDFFDHSGTDPESFLDIKEKILSSEQST